ncbi:hypothetical protein BIV60_11940 [Bacillus sp. MUM 116]|uniref:hypothetical protein n=1 Tax=Bacillus sp. MUM 116 TaxID=1678002 RepID=UPI0008F5B21E|nr:hypothetical protein [Bacillus sp. MUM 116]OIK14213.1 hypothetical protein BIV60_11940 [Bacillus sp. MUM 116]
MIDDTARNQYQQDAMEQHNKNEPYWEEKYVRATFFVRRDLLARLEEEIDYQAKFFGKKKGIKTNIINNILEDYLKKCLEDRIKG